MLKKFAVKNMLAERTLVKDIIGEDLWGLGSWFIFTWESDCGQVLVIRLNRGGRNGFIVRRRACVDELYLDLGDPGLVDGVRNEVRRLL